ncbi:hypothetical protein [Sphingobacterium griseoflavum]|nr:hypothetical protein [Sphingobacterium griseoflavum]
MSLTILSLCCALFFACKKGNDYYENRQPGAARFPGSTIDFLEASPGLYDSLLLALDRSPILRRRLLQKQDTTTLFAITNNSFTNAIEGMNTVRRNAGRRPLYIEDIPQVLLDSALYRYVFANTVTTEDLRPYVEGVEIRSLNDYRMHLQYLVSPASGYVGGGQQQIKLSDVNNSIFQRYWQESFTAMVNIQTENGYVHQLSPSHNFGFSKLITQLASY